MPISADAEKIQKEFDEYAYIVSHDLNAPVRALVEFSKLLSAEEKNSLSPDAQQYLSIIITSGAKLKKMMRGLLDYSRLKITDVAAEEIDTNALVSNCMELLEKEISESGAVVEVEQLPPCYGNAAQIQQVFLAILDNAIKFRVGNAQPAIKISATLQDGNCLFSISDNGIGMRPAFKDDIYKLFYRLHVDEEYSGVGVGLTLADKIIAGHGGKIWCESELGQGTTFFFTLPRAQAN